MLKQGGVEVTLFDRNGPGSGASGVSAGLLHPYTGPHAKVPPNGLQAFQEARQLLQEIAPEALRADGILRLAMSDLQRESFSRTSQNYADVRWIPDCRSIYPHLIHTPGILIKEGLLVDSQRYLETLWQHCYTQGALFVKEEIVTLASFDSYDHVVIALGAETALLPELSSLPLRQVKGQIIRIKWPTAIPQLPLPITGNAYIVPGNEVTIGATYEKPPFVDSSDFAQQELLPKIAEMIALLNSVEVLSSGSGLRAVLPGHLPLVKQIKERSWLITGFGSKGLLYHAFLAKRLAVQIMT